MAAKIIIERHLKERVDRTVEEYYLVKYSQSWFDSWHYLKEEGLGTPEKVFNHLDEAIEAASYKRRELGGLSHSVEDLTETGRPLHEGW